MGAEAGFSRHRNFRLFQQYRREPDITFAAVNVAVGRKAVAQPLRNNGKFCVIGGLPQQELYLRVGPRRRR